MWDYLTLRAVPGNEPDANAEGGDENEARVTVIDQNRQFASGSKVSRAAQMARCASIRLFLADLSRPNLGPHGLCSATSTCGKYACSIGTAGSVASMTIAGTCHCARTGLTPRTTTRRLRSKLLDNDAPRDFGVLVQKIAHRLP